MKRNYAQGLLCPPCVCAGLTALLIYVPYTTVIWYLVITGVTVCFLLCLILKDTARYTAMAILVALCIGMFAGARTVRTQASVKLSAGLAERYIKKITVKIIANIGKTAKGYYKMTGRLLNVHGDYGSKASAQGSCVLIADTELLPSSIVEIPVSTNFEKGIFFVQSKAVYMQGNPQVLEKVRYGMRKAVEAAIERCAGKSAPLVKALLTGYRGDLEQDSIQIFTNAGCAHILALSGQHIAVIALLLSVIICISLGKKFEFVSCASILVIFAWFTGASPSVVRAVLQFLIAGVCSSLGRPQKSIVVFSYSFILAVVLFPETAYTISFKLSYMAVLGIILCNDMCVFMFRRWFPLIAAKALSQGVGALIGTVLISVSTFNKINIISPITSALVSPFVTCLIIGGIAGSVLICVIPGLSTVTQCIIEKIETAMLVLIQAGGKIGILEGAWISKLYFLLVTIAALMYCFSFYRTQRFRRTIAKKIKDMYYYSMPKVKDYNETIT